MMRLYNIILVGAIIAVSFVQGTVGQSVVSNVPTGTCENIKDAQKEICGQQPRVNSRKCKEMGCCFEFSRVRGVPWCFKKVEEPLWMTKLLDLMKVFQNNHPFTVPQTTTIPTTTTTTTTTAATTEVTTTPSIIEQEVKDEIMCQKTYNIFLEVKGSELCSSSGQKRVACQITKKPGESECTACTKIGCCYDATLKTATGFNFIPRCYKSTDMLTAALTTRAPTATTTLDWLNLLAESSSDNSADTALNNAGFVPTKPTTTKPTSPGNSNFDIDKFLSSLMNENPQNTPKPTQLSEEDLNMKTPEKLCYPRECGYRVTDKNVRASQRIVGGQWSGGIEYWPWTSSLRRNFTDDWRYRHICGATVISNNWILTAGHCFTKYSTRSQKIPRERETDMNIFAVTMGNYFRDSAQRTMQVRMLSEYHAHPLYDFESLSYDIAVAKLKEPVAFTDHIQPACLPNKFDAVEVGETAWVTGWGETYNIGRHDKSKLKELPLPLVSSKVCKSYWEEFFHPSWICTEGAYLEDACAGDSGGPLVHRDADRRFDIIGVAIAGTKRCSTDRDDIRPGIYASVAYFRDFVDSFTNGAC